LIVFVIFFFFFQAEDGIRDRDVTGVQTCALPILPATASPRPLSRPLPPRHLMRLRYLLPARRQRRSIISPTFVRPTSASTSSKRSEERRVGKECRSRWARYHEKKKAEVRM